MSGVRLDLVLLECLGRLAEVHPNVLTIWKAGGRDVAAEKLKEMGVPTEPVTVVQAARGLGILGPDPNEIVIRQNKRRAR